MPDVTVGETAAYLAVPVGSPGPWPGVVVIHEAFGLNADIRGHADRLAALGYLALAPDLYGGKSWLRCIRSMISSCAPDRGPRSMPWTRAAGGWPSARTARARPG